AVSTAASRPRSSSATASGSTTSAARRTACRSPASPPPRPSCATRWPKAAWRRSEQATQAHFEQPPSPGRLFSLWELPSSCIAEDRGRDCRRCERGQEYFDRQDVEQGACEE